MAQPRLQISITAPSEVSAGTETLIDAIVSLENYSGSDAVPVQAGFSVDGSVITQREFDLTSQHLLSFTHVFSGSGTKEITVGAQTTIEGEQVATTETTEITVTGGEETGPENPAETDSASPYVAESLIESGDWSVTSRNNRQVFEQQEGAVTVTGTVNTVFYANAALREEIAEKTLENVDTDLSTFFASQITISPPLETLPREPQEILAEVKSVTQDELTERLRNNGVRDVTQTGTQTLSVTTGQVADVQEYEGRYDVSDMSFDIADDTTITIPGGSVTVAAMLAIWHNGEDAFVAGGAYPGENYARTIEKRITEAIRATISIDLGLTPETYRAGLLDLMQTVQ